MNGIYVPIPRDWFAKDGVWWRLDNEQRGALATLLSFVTYHDYEFETKLEKIQLRKGQVITSTRQLQKKLNLTEWKARALVDLLKKEGVISIDYLNNSLTQNSSHFSSQLSILTFNDLHNTASHLSSHLSSQELNIINTNNSLSHKRAREEEKDSIVIEEEHVRPYRSFAVGDELTTEIFSHHQEWIERYCMNQKMSAEEFRQQWNLFIEYLQNRGEQRKEVDDATKHFYNWRNFNNNNTTTNHATTNKNKQSSGGYADARQQDEDFLRFAQDFYCTGD